VVAEALAEVAVVVVGSRMLIAYSKQNLSSRDTTD
jgi:hypothetical protein